MSILLGGVLIPGYDQKVSATLPIAGEDLSGNSSHSPQAETGDKPKVFTVVTHVKFADQSDLRLIVNLAEARNDVDERVAYNIINDTAKAMNIKQVRFQGDLMVRELHGFEAWSVSFKLIEYLSVPEKKEGRVKPKSVTEQVALGVLAAIQPVSVEQVKQSMIEQIPDELLPDVIPSSIADIKAMVEQIPGAKLLGKIPISMELMQEIVVDQVIDSPFLKKQTFAMSEVTQMVKDQIIDGDLFDNAPVSLDEMKKVLVAKISKSSLVDNNLISVKQITQIMDEQLPADFFTVENAVDLVETAQEVALESMEGVMAFLDERLQ